MSYAFFSVTDKTGIEHLAKSFTDLGVSLISTGGTKDYLEKYGFEVISIEEITKKPEAFQGRMKSISFEMASGILFRRQDPSDQAQAEELNIPRIDYVVINFYPFLQKQKEGVLFENLIDFIDIGGPSLLRAAAKNFEDVTVLSHASQYETCIAQLLQEGKTSRAFRMDLAKEAFCLTASYDKSIHEAFLRETGAELRYGENPHQKAMANVDAKYWKLLQQNKEMSYNNYLDAHHAWLTAIDLQSLYPEHVGAVVVKHNNPCGLAVAAKGLTALHLAWQGDPVSAFGGVVAINQPVDTELASFFKDKFIEVLLAPSYSEEALSILKSKPQTRVIELPLHNSFFEQRTAILAGELWQEVDQKKQWTLDWKTKVKPKGKDKLVEFAFLAAKHLKSNAIVIAREVDGDFQMLGAGMGQPNRIDCIKRLAIPRIKEYFSNIDMKDVVLASDAFFPFSDSVEACHQEGIRTIVQPGGSIRDPEVIAAADSLGLAMAFTSTRHFKH